jgi:hypothetical protein
MKPLFIVILFIFSFSTHAQGVVFSAQNGASLTISENASVNFNGMKLSPSTDLTLSENGIELSNTPLSGTFSSTTRIYNFNNTVSFSGDLKVYYDDSVEELNGIDEANLNIALLGSDLNWVEVSSVVLDETENTIIASLDTQEVGAIALVESGSILSVVTNNNNKLRVYPNPVESILHISSNENYKVNVYDLSGKLVLKQKVNNSFNLSMLPSATYLMSLSDIEGKVIEQFTIIKK